MSSSVRLGQCRVRKAKGRKEKESNKGSGRKAKGSGRKAPGNNNNHDNFHKTLGNGNFHKLHNHRAKGKDKGNGNRHNNNLHNNNRNNNDNLHSHRRVSGTSNSSFHNHRDHRDHKGNNHWARARKEKVVKLGRKEKGQLESNSSCALGATSQDIARTSAEAKQEPCSSSLALQTRLSSHNSGSDRNRLLEHASHAISMDIEHVIARTVFESLALRLSHCKSRACSSKLLNFAMENGLRSKLHSFVMKHGPHSLQTRTCLSLQALLLSSTGIF